MHKAAQALFRAEDASDLFSNPSLQEGLGGGLAVLPAFLGAHGHGSIGELQKMLLPVLLAPTMTLRPVAKVRSASLKTVKSLILRDLSTS